MAGVQMSQRIKLNDNAILLTLYFILFGCITYGGLSGDNTNTTESTIRLIDAGFLKNDWLVNLYDSFNIRSYFIWATAPIYALIGNVEQSYAALYIVTYIATGVALYQLARSTGMLGPKALFVALFSAAFGSTFWTFACTNYFRGDFAPHSLGILFMIISLRYFLVGKDKLMAITIGIGAFFQQLIGLHFFGAAVGARLIEAYSKKKKIDRRTLFSFFVFIPLMLLALAPVLIARFSGTQESPSDLFFIIRGSHLYHPSTWPITHYFIFASFCMLSYFSYLKSDIPQKIKSQFAALVLMSFVFFVVGFLFVDVFSIGVIKQLQLFRIVALVYLIGYLFIGEFIYNKIFKSKNITQIFAYSVLTFSLLNETKFIPIFAIIWAAESIRPDSKKFAKIIVGVVPVFVTASMIALRMISYKFVVIEVLFLGAYLVLKYAESKNLFTSITNVISVPLSLFAKYAEVFALIVLILIASILPIETRAHIMDNFRPLVLLALFSIFVLSLRKNSLSEQRNYVQLFLVFLMISASNWAFPLSAREKRASDYSEMVKFIKANTPSESIILVSPTLITFRHDTKRAVIVDVKNSAVDAAPAEWLRRIGDLTNHIDLLPPDTDRKYSEGYQALDMTEIKNLQKKYKFNYVVSSAKKNLTYTKVFSNSEYSIYETNAN